MRRVGTISSAAGLIFLGIWMIIGKTNAELAAEIFKWWPAILVILGLEVLISFSMKNSERVKINYLIIPILIILLSVNVYEGIKYSFGNIFKNVRISDLPDIHISGLDINNYRIIKASKTLPLRGDRVYFKTSNASVNIFRSAESSLKIEADVYVDKNSTENKYEINENNVADGYDISINEAFVKKAEIDIYVPDGYDVKVNVDNLDFRAQDEFNSTKLDVVSNNCSVKIEGSSGASLDFNNGSVNINDTKDIDLKGDNVNVNISGKSENITVGSQLGRVSVDNEVCRDVNIDLNQGVVTLKTLDKNVGVNVDLDQGVAEINSQKRVNSGISETFGSGAGKVRINMNQGAVKFNN